MTYHIGIDPGLSGACVVLDHHGNAIYHDCPRRAGAAKLSVDQHDPKAMLNLLLLYVGKSQAILELVRFDSRDEQHKVSAEILVRTHEAWRTVLECLDIPTQHLYPVQWRRPLGLSGDVGEVYVNEALRLYPQCRSWLYYKSKNRKWKQNHNRAESLLMGHVSKLLHMESAA